MILLFGWMALSIVPRSHCETVTNTKSCQHHLFMKEGVTQGFGRDHPLMVTVRVFHSSCEREVQITLTRDEISDTVECILMVAEDKSVLEQLVDLKKAEPAVSISDLCSKVRIREYRTDSTKIFSLKEILGQLEPIKMSPIPPPYLIVHGVPIDIWIWSGIGEAWFSFSGTDWPPPDDLELGPMESWVYSLFSALDVRCEESDGSLFKSSLNATERGTGED